MNQREINRLKMIKQVLDITSANHAAWGSMVVFDTTFTELTNTYDQLTALVYEPIGSLTGITKLQKEKREDATGKALVLKSALHVHDKHAHDTILEAKIGFGSSELKRISGIAFIQRLELILALASDNLVHLSSIGISQQDLDDLSGLIGELKTMQGSPRTAIIDRKENGFQIDALFEEIDGLLFQLDQLVVVLNVSQQEFARKFKDARKIVDQKGKSNKPGEDDEENGNDELPDGPVTPAPPTGPLIR